MKKIFGYILLIGILGQGCEGFWGKKTSTDFLDEPVFDDKTVAYVPIQPAWNDLGYPIDVVAGWDELIYVADQATEEIISLGELVKSYLAISRYFS